MSGESPFKRIAILGAGLIGSSISHAVRGKLRDAAVVLFDKEPRVRARARELGLGEIADTAGEAVRGADLVILAVPVGAMAAAAEEIKDALSPGVVVSDVGSVKGAVVEALRALNADDVFVIPAHPVSGTERSGPDAGFGSLFEGRWLIITALADARPAYAEKARRLEEFWRALGANVERMDANHHDLVLAITSHLPHLIAFNIVATAEDLEKVTESEVVKYSAGGFRDFTRIAASDPIMWRDVFLTNREAVLEVLGRFTEDLAALQRAIRWGDGQLLFDTFTRARRVRREVIDAGQDTAAPNWGRDET